MATQRERTIFPQLIQADHLAGSDLGVDTPVILRFATVSGDTVQEHAVALYYLGSDELLA